MAIPSIGNQFEIKTPVGKRAPVIKAEQPQPIQESFDFSGVSAAPTQAAPTPVETPQVKPEPATKPQVAPDSMETALKQSAPGVSKGPAGTLMMEDPAAQDPMAEMYPTMGIRPEYIGPSLNAVGKLVGESGNVARTVQQFRDQFPEVEIYPAERLPGDDRVIMDMRYVLHGADKDNQELKAHLDAQRAKTFQYWYDR